MKSPFFGGKKSTSGNINVKLKFKGLSLQAYDLKRPINASFKVVPLYGVWSIKYKQISKGWFL